MSLDTDLEFPVLCLTWRVDAAPYGSRDCTYSSEFRFQGKRCRLAFRSGYENRLALLNVSGGPHEPFYAAVDVVNGSGQILPELKREKHWGKNMGYPFIWRKYVAAVVREYPDFYRNNGGLRFRVLLKADAALLKDVKYATIQTEELAPHPVKTRTSTTVHRLASAAGQSSGTASTSTKTTLLLNTPDCLLSLSQDFSKMLHQGMDTDVEFQCGDHTTRAHGAVVSARSEVIASMLASDMVEGRTRVVKIPNMEHEVFKHFLRYIYTGQLPELTVDLALNLYESGDQYAVLGLAKRCSQYLQKHLTVENSLDVLIVADAHANAELKEAVIDFMVVNRVPRVSDRWKDFRKAHPMLTVEVLDRFCTWLDQ